MSLLAVPVAVLVLAWDETAPAVRALMDATDAPEPALDSVVVVVPAVTGEPSQEEFLPLPAEPALPQAAEEPLGLAVEAALNEQAEALPLSELLTLPDLPPNTPAATTLPALGTAEGASPTPKPASLPTPVAPIPLARQEVRVLRLSSFDLPELTGLSHQALPRPIWQSRVVLPTAPYLGSQPEITTGPTAAPQAEPQSEAAQLLISLAGISLPAAPTPSAGLPTLPLPESSAPAPTYLLTELPPALDAEADLAPVAPDELDAAETAPTEAPLAETHSYAQAGWPDALAALRTPLPIDEPAAALKLEDEATYYAATVGEAPATDAEPSAPPLVSHPFEAPDLNFQVIQYARFAVPVALAQVPFAAIYAPAWPTWLAAQELRHRTRQPLVLHVATLAASDDQSLETATGWQAELQRQALQRADLILAETPELTRRLRHDLGLPPELVRTVPAADTTAVALALRTAHVRTSGSAA